MVANYKQAEGLSAHEKAERAVRMVREAKNLVYDTETSGLDWKRCFPVGYVFTSSPRDSYYVPVRHLGGCNLEDTRVPDGSHTGPDSWDVTQFEKDIAKAFRERALDPTKRTVGHNLKFDYHMSLNAGITLGRNVVCTQITEVLLDEHAKGFSLDACARRYRVQAKKGEALYAYLADMFNKPNNREIMGYFGFLPGNDAMAVEYAEGDGVTTGMVFNKQLPLIQQQELDQIWEIENRLIWTLVRMERRGIKVDEQELDKLDAQLTKWVEQMREELPEGFNENSGSQVQKLCEAAGKTDWPLTPLGNPSFPGKWLQTFDEGQKVVNIRRYTKLQTSFIHPLRNEHLWRGRVHSNLNQLRSDVGGTPARLSSSQPNLQQVPKRDKELAPMFRRVFVPDEGYRFWEGDYSQMEPRLFAHYSGAPSLVEGYCKQPFRDAHSTVAELLGVERDPTAKRMNMGLLTGMQKKTFAEHMDWPLERAAKAHDLYFSALPEIEKFHELARRVIKTRGYIRTLLGRRGRLDSQRFAYKAV